MMKKIFLFILLTFTMMVGVKAADFITDVMLIGGSADEVKTLKTTYTAQGWTVVDKDLNQGAGGDFIYLLYKTGDTDGITDFYLTSSSADNLTHDGRSYSLTPYDGGSHFKTMKGNLNSGCGSGSADIYLYYTREAFSHFRAVTGITFDATKSGAVGAKGGFDGYDLNTDAKGEYVYMHPAFATQGGTLDVASEYELRSAMWIGATGLRMVNDIKIEREIVIESGCSMTLDLNGHTLDRGLTSAASYGHVIKVLSGGSATISDSAGGGKITGGYTNSGGALRNEGTLTITGGTITGNHSTSNGAGIWNEGTLNVEGSPVVTGNTGGKNIESNVYLKAGTLINITGAISEGTQIGVTMENFYGTFTNGYLEHNGEAAPETVFTSDFGADVTLHDGEAYMSMSFVKRSWNDAENKVDSTFVPLKEFSILSSNTGDSYTRLEDGWYVVTQNISFKKCLHIIGDVKLVLCDGVTLTAEDGIYIQYDKTLAVYAQGKETGKIYAHSDSGPGIGGMNNTKGGHFIVHGGVIDAKAGSVNNAGIGGGNHESGIQSVTIYGGTVTAEGHSSGAGIGKGQQNNLHETITIYGGNVTALGGRYGAGIGGGEDRGNGIVYIYGGTVYAKGGFEYGAGIGGGEGGSLDSPVYVYGGDVTAIGGDSAAGIGGGYNGSQTHPVYIYGGTVYVLGGYHAASLGGGEGGIGGQLYVYGGHLTARGCDPYASDETALLALGDGPRKQTHGCELTVGADMAIKYVSRLLKTSDEDHLRNGTSNWLCDTEIFPCTHEGCVYVPDLIDTHSRRCEYCENQDVSLHTLDDDGKCTECGANVCKVTFYLPKDNTNTGVYEPLLEFKMEKGSTLNLISTLKTVDGMEFEGWTEGKASNGSYEKADGETLLSVGTPYTINGPVDFTARYRVVEQELPKGDVNGDGLVDINDVVCVINHMAGTAVWPRANVNGDTDPSGTSIVDINDVVAIINQMAQQSAR